MISLLNPLFLWLGLAGLIPILIHFWGRKNPKIIHFPSLLLFKERFEKVNSRQRIRNMLLMMLRILTILCLMLSVVKPFLMSGTHQFVLGRNGIVLINNGASSAAVIESGANMYQSQMSLWHSLDSLGGAVKSIYLNECLQRDDCPEIIHRHGRFEHRLEQLRRMLQMSHEKTDFVLIPVVDWLPFKSLYPLFQQLIRRHPHTHFIFVDYVSDTNKPPHILALDTSYSNKGNRTLHFSLSWAQSRKGNRFKLIRNGMVEQNQMLQPSGAIPSSDAVFHSLSLPPSHGLWSSGYGLFPVSQPSGPYARWYFAYPPGSKVRLLHIGQHFISLPSLGQSHYSVSIDHTDTFTDAFSSDGWADYQAIFIFNEPLPSDKYADALFAYVQAGGTLILGLGPSSNISLINRRLLMPGRMAYLKGVQDLSRQSGRGISYIAGSLHTSAFSQVNNMIKNVSVHQQMEMTPNQGTDIILKSEAGPVLARKKIGKGQIVVWTTNINDIEWTTLGGSPFVPLYHQYIGRGDPVSSERLNQTHSDSTFTFQFDDSGVKHSAEIQVTDRKGRNILPVEVKGNRAIIGPFDRTGIYKISHQADSILFAVNLKRRHDQYSKTRFREQMNDGKTPAFSIFSPDQFRSSLKLADSGLWKWALVVALICIVGECLVTRYYSRTPD